jgi:hypothetical protein
LNDSILINKEPLLEEDENSKVGRCLKDSMNVVDDEW